MSKTCSIRPQKRCKIHCFWCFSFNLRSHHLFKNSISKERKTIFLVEKRHCTIFLGLKAFNKWCFWMKYLLLREATRAASWGNKCRLVRVQKKVRRRACKTTALFRQNIGIQSSKQRHCFRIDLLLNCSTETRNVKGRFFTA